MTNPGRKRRKRKTVLGVFFRLFFVLLLLSMLAAYISNQVAISSKRAELQTLQEQISQLKPHPRSPCGRPDTIRRRTGVLSFGN